MAVEAYIGMCRLMLMEAYLWLCRLMYGCVGLCRSV